jgi:hypothetical protein
MKIIQLKMSRRLNKYFSKEDTQMANRYMGGKLNIN